MTGCAAVINEKRVLKENDHQDMKTLLTPPQQNFMSVKKRKPKIEDKVYIDPIFNTKISLTVHDEAPLRSALTEAAKKIGIAILIDHDIKTTMHYVAHEKPFIQVITDITQALNLRFETQGKFIKIEKDTPYPKTYPVHFLKFERESSNSISTATDMTSDHDAKNQTKNNSDTEIKVKSTINFWDELESGLKFYLGTAPFTVHRQGGLVSVMATEKQHRFVKDYLDKLQKVSNTQVLIEAKIIEVRLKQEFKTGIDWSFVNTGANANPGFQAGPTKIGDNMQILNFNGSNFNMLINALEHFGSLRTVSSPRIVLLNNQTSIIKVAENSIFFKVDYQTQYLGLVAQPKNGDDNERFKIFSSSEIKSKPIGFIMPIQACIDKTTGKILLFVRPTVSRQSGYIEDPTVAFNALAAKITTPLPPSKIPIVEVREMDSVLQLDSGDVKILGGLMQVTSRDDSKSLPKPAVLDKLRTVLGHEDLDEEVYELVILIKATIIDDEDDAAPDAADLRLQKDFVKDPRPLRG